MAYRANKTENKLPKLELDTTATKTTSGFEAWVDTNRDFCDIHVSRSRQKHFHAIKRNWRLGSLVLGQAIVSPYGFSRGPGNRWHANTEFVRVRIYRNAGGKGIYSSVATKFSPGDIHIFDMGQEYAGYYEEGEKLSVYIPYDMIGYDPSIDPNQIHLPCASHVGRVLRSYLISLFDSVQDVSLCQARILEDGLVRLVESIIKANPLNALTSECFSVARHNAMVRFIDDHIAEPDLNADKLCRSFGASRATIYRDFAKVGGVSNFIKSRRLQRAYRDLATGSDVSGFVGKVAEQWGFASQSHFSRMFKEAFGVTPRNVYERVRDNSPSSVCNVTKVDWYQWFR